MLKRETKLKRIENYFLKLNKIDQETTISNLCDAIKKEDSIKIYSPKTAYEYIKYKFLFKEQEHLQVMFLKGNNIVNSKLITIGTNNQTLISSRDIIKEALLNNSSAIIIAHNHPSEDATPSREDRIATEKLKEACQLIDLVLLDHLIITNKQYYSFKENNLL